MKASSLFLALVLVSPALYAQEVSDDAVERVDVGTQNVLERLKLLRVQMALDREEIEALELRLQKLALQKDFEAAVGGVKAAKKAKPARTSASEIIVKAISLKPKKEAIILFRGRIFTVRPGDVIADLVIKDISEQGLQISGKGDKKATPAPVR
jgi:hypothetical protein